MNAFTYDYPVKNYFGEGAVERALEAELPHMGEKVMLAYGGGSVKRSGLYDKLVAALHDSGKTVIPFCTSASSPLGDSGDLLAQMAGTGNWQEGMRFSSSASEDDVTDWLRGLNL